MSDGTDSNNPLFLPNAPKELFLDAANAVKEEYRKSTKWKELKALKVTTLSSDTENQIFVIHVGRLIEFEWTWEGAMAFRPENTKDFQDFAEQGGEVVLPFEEDKIVLGHYSLLFL